jgi:hypothetical protein
MASRPLVPTGPAVGAHAPTARRKRRSTGSDNPNVRYFLLKPGSSIENPELGEEVQDVKQVLVRSFRTNQPFLTLIAWNAVEDTSEESGNSPTIVKQAMSRP